VCVHQRVCVHVLTCFVRGVMLCVVVGCMCSFCLCVCVCVVRVCLSD